MAPEKSSPVADDKHTVSVRLALASAQRLRVVAASEGLSMGAYLARLWEQSPVAQGHEDRL